MSSVNGWNAATSYQGIDQNAVGRIEDDFEAAALGGRNYTMDRLIDRLSRNVEFEDGWTGRRRRRTDQTLDQLGRDARLGRGGLTSEDNELIQRLRSASLAEANGDDGLMSALGDVDNKQLLEAGGELADRLRAEGRHSAARAVERVLEDLEAQIEKEEASAPGDLDDRAAAFEEAAGAGDGEALDEIIDQLAGDVKSDGSARDRRLEEIDKGLDELGGMARDFGADGVGEGQTNPYADDNETIQRLRSAVLATRDGSDGLATALGDMPLNELLERAQDLSDKLSDAGYDDLASNVDEAIEVLQSLHDREERFGQIENDGSLVQQHNSMEDAVEPSGWY